MHAICETSSKHPAQRILYTDDHGHGLGYPSWSPDGTRLVYACLRDATGQPHAICEINPDYPTPHVLYSNYKITLTRPTWNTDGSQILVTVQQPDKVSPEIALLSPSGGALRVLASGSDARG